MRRGEWQQCASCGEESIYIGRDAVDWICSVCGCSAPMVDAEEAANMACRQITYHSM
jgi:predicted RNA-binding Zn-ribbon protein involved in translation (DUF1610 family)